MLFGGASGVAGADSVTSCCASSAVSDSDGGRGSMVAGTVLTWSTCDGGGAADTSLNPPNSPLMGDEDETTALISGMA